MNDEMMYNVRVAGDAPHFFDWTTWDAMHYGSTII